MTRIVTTIEPAIDPRAFRDASGWFATGVTVITTRDHDGAPVGFTANSFTSVSLDPPLVSFALYRGANCHAAFAAARHFAVNVLAEDQEELSRRFAGIDSDKWRGIAFTLGETGCPLFEGVLAGFECARYAAYEGGDHDIFLGRVLHITARRTGSPLIFCRGSYAALGPALDRPTEAPLPRATSVLENGEFSEIS
jgi:flavin reductase (DIM6/NTAB) family NADH-FMN oxidoreductase RutF